MTNIAQALDIRDKLCDGLQEAILSLRAALEPVSTPLEASDTVPCDPSAAPKPTGDVLARINLGNERLDSLTRQVHGIESLLEIDDRNAAKRTDDDRAVVASAVRWDEA